MKIWNRIVIDLFAISLTTGSVECKAQTQEWKKHDVAVVYGWNPLNDRNFWDGNKYKSIGMVSAQYVFSITKGFGIGGVFGYQHYSHRHFDYVANDLTGMLIIRANWVNKSDYSLYSKAGIGMHFMNDDDNVKSDYTTTAAIIPLPSIGGTFSLGNGFFGLAEFSLFSSQGLFLVGAGYRF